MANKAEELRRTKYERLRTRGGEQGTLDEASGRR